MAQNDLIISNQSFPSFRTDLNNALQAINSNHSGSTTPSGAVAGTIWLDTTNATIPLLKYYDGVDNITLATINHSTNTVDFNDSTISTPLAVTGNATAGAEIRLPEDTDNGTNFVAIKAPDSIASNLTFTLPTAHGTAGQVLTTNGSGGVLSFTTPSAGISWQSSVETSNFTADAGEGYFCNTTSAGFTVTLPATPTAGQQVALVDYAGTFDTNALTINPNGEDILGQASNVLASKDREAITLTYIDSTQGWLPISGYQEGTTGINIPYTVDFLVIAGGGGGGGSEGSSTPGAGGGAGGYRNSYSTESSGGGGSSETSLTFTIATVYTVTVGAGGSGGSQVADNASSAGTSGSNSSISGTGITTITSSGGGGGCGIGGSGNAPAFNGGSGGGGNQFNTKGTGTANQGFDGGRNASANGGSSAGGGGASGAGQDQQSSNGGSGGAGLASLITGSSVSRSGGGGGGAATGGNGGAATAGGGNGGNSSLAGNSGTANSGGGAGGNSQNSNATGLSGGSGVVILRIPTANYSGTTTGSPTVTTDGSDKVIVFNSSGSITG